MNETTLLFGKIISPYLLVSGLGFILSSTFYTNLLIHSEKSDPMTVNLSGMVHFFIGIAIVTHHFMWNNLLAIFVTILGFVFLIKGIILIVFPKSTLKSTQSSVKLLRLSGVGFVAMGLYLGYMSYFN